jgi:hypothetical protein
MGVRPGAARQVRTHTLVDARGASADVVRSAGVVSDRVDLGGRTTDEHPRAADLDRAVSRVVRRWRLETARVTAVSSFGSRLFEVGFRALGLRRRLVGGEHLPRTGPAILGSNHIGYLDVRFAMLAPPRPRREIRSFARAGFFEQPVTGFLLRQLGQIPVAVHGGAPAAIATGTELLRRAELVGLHPEGTISPSFVPRPARSGATRLADPPAYRSCRARCGAASDS